MTECLIANYSLIAVKFLFGNNMKTIYFKPLKGIQKSSLFQKKISALFKFFKLFNFEAGRLEFYR